MPPGARTAWWAGLKGPPRPPTPASRQTATAPNGQRQPGAHPGWSMSSHGRRLPDQDSTQISLLLMFLKSYLLADHGDRMCKAGDAHGPGL